MCKSKKTKSEVKNHRNNSNIPLFLKNIHGRRVSGVTRRRKPATKKYKVDSKASQLTKHIYKNKYIR